MSQRQIETIHQYRDGTERGSSDGEVPERDTKVQARAGKDVREWKRYGAQKGKGKAPLRASEFGHCDHWKHVEERKCEPVTRREVDNSNENGDHNH